MEFLLVLLVLSAAVLLITGPLRRVEASEEREVAERDRLAAAREAKYREIRELELDFRTGKLSREDYRAQDAARRAEAVEILRALDELDGAAAPEAGPQAAAGSRPAARSSGQAKPPPGAGSAGQAGPPPAAGSASQPGAPPPAGSADQPGAPPAAPVPSG